MANRPTRSKTAAIDYSKYDYSEDSEDDFKERSHKTFVEDLDVGIPPTVTRPPPMARATRNNNPVIDLIGSDSDPDEYETKKKATKLSKRKNPEPSKTTASTAKPAAPPKKRKREDDFVVDYDDDSDCLSEDEDFNIKELDVENSDSEFDIEPPTSRRPPKKGDLGDSDESDYEEPKTKKPPPPKSRARKKRGYDDSDDEDDYGDSDEEYGAKPKKAPNTTPKTTTRTRGQKATTTRMTPSTRPQRVGTTITPSPTVQTYSYSMALATTPTPTSIREGVSVVPIKPVETYSYPIVTTPLPTATISATPLASNVSTRPVRVGTTTETQSLQPLPLPKHTTAPEKTKKETSGTPTMKPASTKQSVNSLQPVPQPIHRTPPILPSSHPSDPLIDSVHRTPIVREAPKRKAEQEDKPLGFSSPAKRPKVLTTGKPASGGIPLLSSTPVRVGLSRRTNVPPLHPK